MEKLARDRPGQVKISAGAKKYLNSREILDLSWNGREIRKAFQTAIVLAEHVARRDPDTQKGEPIFVEKDQFELVRKMNQQFRSYLEGIRGMDQVDRARQYYMRNDAVVRHSKDGDEA